MATETKTTKKTAKKYGWAKKAPGEPGRINVSKVIREWYEEADRQVRKRMESGILPRELPAGVEGLRELHRQMPCGSITDRLLADMAARHKGREKPLPELLPEVGWLLRLALDMLIFSEMVTGLPAEYRNYPRDIMAVLIWNIESELDGQELARARRRRGRLRLAMSC